ncbi:MAG: hypothetical protein MR679_01930, partial [Bacteroidales bacterium]|nr:hypothetical protein [Bacteroidales bacterium]
FLIIVCLLYLLTSYIVYFIAKKTFGLSSGGRAFAQPTFRNEDKIKSFDRRPVVLAAINHLLFIIFNAAQRWLNSTRARLRFF